MADPRVQVEDNRKPFGVIYRLDVDSDTFRALSPCAVRTYVVLTTFAGRETGEAWPRQSTLATIVGASERSIRRAVAELDGAGLIDVRVKDPASFRRVNVYTLV